MLKNLAETLSQKTHQAAEEHHDFGAKVMENLPGPNLISLHHLVSYHLLTGVSNTLNRLAQPKSPKITKSH
jgi:hypothetical protein